MAGHGRAHLRDVTTPQSPSALGGSTVISNLPEYQRRLSERVGGYAAIAPLTAAALVDQEPVP